MAERYRIPNFRKLYPEASDEVISVLRKTERQMQYREYDIKSEMVKVDQSEKTVTYIPSREDSLERLCEISHQFAVDQLSVEDAVICRQLHETLYAALRSLAEDEQQLILQLYFYGRTERELAKLMALSHTAVHKRKARILSKLKNNLCLRVCKTLSQRGRK